MSESIKHSFTNKDMERGYSVCDVCKDKIHTHQAGFECARVECDICGYSVIAAVEFERPISDLGAEWMSK